MTLRTILLLGLLVAGPAIAQDGPLQVTRVQGAVYMITGDGGNIGVSVGDGGLLMVDDKFAPLADALRAALAHLGSGRLRFLLNTHHHGDHTGGNAAFGADVPIIAQENVRARLDRPETPAAALPVVTFLRSVSVYLNGEEIEVLHIPHAHTDGDAVVFFHGSNVVHTGDILFNRRFPFVDLDSGGSVEGVKSAVRTILQRIGDDTKIIPGHGPLADAQDLRTYLRMLEESQRVVAAGIAAGTPLEALQAAGVGAEWAGYGWEFVSTADWVATVYRDLAAGG